MTDRDPEEMERTAAVVNLDECHLHRAARMAGATGALTSADLADLFAEDDGLRGAMARHPSTGRGER